MRTARSLTVSPYLVLFHTGPPQEQPRTPPRATTHAPQEQPCMPPREQPRMPPSGATTHAPPLTESQTREKHNLRNTTFAKKHFWNGKYTLEIFSPQIWLTFSSVRNYWYHHFRQRFMMFLQGAAWRKVQFHSFHQVEQNLMHSPMFIPIKASWR